MADEEKAQLAAKYREEERRQHPSSFSKEEDDVAPPPYAYPEDELRAEAEEEDDPRYYEESKDEAKEEQIIEHELDWASRAPRMGIASTVRLAVPVLVPQVHPGLQQPYMRAWAPILHDHDVLPDEFLLFIDHLNVCRAASPPLQVLNLAGTVAGFVPLATAQIAGIATNVVATSAAVAMAKTRMNKYLARSNEKYFNPRGLRVRTAKDSIVCEIAQVPPTAPVLMDVKNSGQESGTYAPLRDRRVKAMEGYIAPLQFEDLPAAREEKGKLDRLSKKLTDRKTAKKEQKMAKKHAEDSVKNVEEREKITQKIQEENEKLDKDLRKHPEDAAKIEKERRKKVGELEAELKRFSSQGSVSSNKSELSKQEKEARKFLWIVVENMDAPIQRQPSTLEKFKASRGREGSPRSQSPASSSPSLSSPPGYTEAGSSRRM